MYEKELEAISHFNLGSPVKEIVPITHGNINRTYNFTLENGNKYVLQNVNVNVFKKPYELMENVNGICRHIRAKAEKTGADTEKSALNFAVSDDGTPLYRNDEGKYFRICSYIEGATYQSISRPQLFHNAARAFGNFQNLLSDYPAKKLHETIPNFHDTVVRYNDFINSKKNCKIAERLAETKGECEYLESREPLAHIAVDAIASGRMPVRVTHNDTKLNNVIFDEATDEGLCVIDLDTVMPGSVLYDFGDAIRFGACTTAEDDPDTSKIALDLELFTQFTKGYVEGVGSSLTDAEYDLLAEGALLMTYELALRFLADYLDGDTYFKINYEKHNLVRTKAQIALLRDMEAKLPEMKRIVAECRA